MTSPAVSPSATTSPWKVTLVYVGLSVLWIVFSDHLLGQQAALPAGAVRWSVLKGVVWVLFSAILLYLVLAKLSRSNRLFAVALNAAANAVLITNPDGTIVWVNPAFEKMTGYSRSEAVGRNPRILKSGVHGKDLYLDLWSTIRQGKLWRGEMINRKKNGQTYSEEMTIAPVLSESGEITHFIAVKQDVTARKNAEEELRREREKYRLIFENAVVGIYQSAPDGRYLYMNNALASMFGYASPAEWEQEAKGNPHPVYVDAAKRTELLIALERDGIVRGFEIEVFRRDGSRMWLSENLRIVRDPEGSTLLHEGTAQDVSQRKSLELQLWQAQRLEAVGRLAGGVAHDFNNMLGVILGYGDILETQLPPGHAARNSAEEIRKAAHRAASLTRQLLAFSRKQILQPRVLNLNGLISDLSKMLRRLIGDDVDLVFQADEALARVKADPGQIEQIIMNLAVNSRDAMPEGGKLFIHTQNADLDESVAARHAVMKPGRYVMLSVSDTGTGMDAATIAHIFEPFFTTKELNKGTGLGLAIVYGIVKQSGGYIWVYSEPGRGTTFKIYLPRTEESAALVAPEPSAARGGSETILLVDDEPSLCEMTKAILAGAGYRVIEANGPREALEKIASAPGPVHLLLTDVVMGGGMSGPSLAHEIVSRQRHCRVIYMTGFSGDLSAWGGSLASDAALLTKPFSAQSLLQRVRVELDHVPAAYKLAARGQSGHSTGVKAGSD